VVNRLEADRALAVLFNVRATPTLFVNGIRLEGPKLKALDQYIAAERSAGVALIGEGVPLEQIYPARVLKNLVGVGADLPARLCPGLADAPWRGSAVPLVTIVELSDFECAFCKRAQPALEQAVKRQGEYVRHVWKDFPLRQHRHAHAAAALGRAAYLEGGNEAFWRVHRELYASSKPLEDAELARIASAAGLDAGAMKAVRDGLHDAALQAELEEATKLGARGIPTYFVNGLRLDGATPEQLGAAIALERQRAARLVAAGVPRGKVYDALCGRP
jgi:protein-disulfide isomerase